MGCKAGDKTVKVRRPFACGLIEIVGTDMYGNRSVKTFKRLMSLPLSTPKSVTYQR